MDVTKRYTKKYNEVLTRRTACPEQWLNIYINALSQIKSVHARTHSERPAIQMCGRSGCLICCCFLVSSSGLPLFFLLAKPSSPPVALPSPLSSIATCARTSTHEAKLLNSSKRSASSKRRSTKDAPPDPSSGGQPEGNSERMESPSLELSVKSASARQLLLRLHPPPPPPLLRLRRPPHQSLKQLNLSHYVRRIHPQLQRLPRARLAFLCRQLLHLLRLSLPPRPPPLLLLLLLQLQLSQLLVLALLHSSALTQRSSPLAVVSRRAPRPRASPMHLSSRLPCLPIWQRWHSNSPRMDRQDCARIERSRRRPRTVAAAQAGPALAAGSSSWHQICPSFLIENIHF